MALQMNDVRSGLLDAVSSIFKWAKVLVPEGIRNATENHNATREGTFGALVNEFTTSSVAFLTYKIRDIFEVNPSSVSLFVESHSNKVSILFPSKVKISDIHFWTFQYSEIQNMKKLFPIYLKFETHLELINKAWRYRYGGHYSFVEI